MKRYHVIIVVFLFGVVGCTDTIDTMSREYRNTNNEAIDALMMIVDEPSAKRMSTRVFKNLNARYKQIDEKIKVVETNRSRKDMVKEMLESDGFQIYLSELEMNRMRFTMEMNRLRNLAKQYEDAQEKCPTISELVGGGAGGGDLEILKTQLMQPKLFEVFAKFPNWKEPSYPGLYEKFLKRRETTFKSKENIKFIN